MTFSEQTVPMKVLITIQELYLMTNLKQKYIFGKHLDSTPPTKVLISTLEIFSCKLRLKHASAIDLNFLNFNDRTRVRTYCLVWRSASYSQVIGGGRGRGGLLQQANFVNKFLLIISCSPVFCACIKTAGMLIYFINSV